MTSRVCSFAAAIALFMLIFGTALCEELLLSITSENYPHIQALLTGEVTIPECRIVYSTQTLAAIEKQFAVGAASDVIEVDIEQFLTRTATQATSGWTLLPVFLLRQFPDVAVSTQMATFKETRVFPIRTCLALRKDLAVANAWLPEAVFNAFCEAKRRAQAAGKIPLPWRSVSREETIELMGSNYWTYGVKNNPRSLHTLIERLKSFGGNTASIELKDMFSAETYELLDQ